MMLKALLLDVDGTLAETEEAHRICFNAAFEALGLSWRWSRDVYGDLLKVSGGKERIRYYCQKQGLSIDEQHIRQLHAHKTELFGARARGGGMPLRPGIEALLREAPQQGLRLAITTTTSRINVDNLFAGTVGSEVLEGFDAICTAETAPTKKPAPDVYLAALSALNLAPQECLAVEDTRNGVLSAAAAGIPVVVTMSMYSQAEDFRGALVVLRDLSEYRVEDIKALHGAIAIPVTFGGPTRPIICKRFSRSRTLISGGCAHH